MIDDILLQEIYSLKERLKIATRIVKYYCPTISESDFMHDIGTEDFQLYIENNKHEESKNNENKK